MSITQVAASPPVLVRGMAGLTSWSTIKVCAPALTSDGAWLTVMSTDADEDSSAELAATILTVTAPAVALIGVPVI